MSSWIHNEKLCYLAEIEANYALAKIEALAPGVVSTSTVDTFKNVIESLEELLGTGLPAFIELKRVRDKIAYSKERIAFIYSLFGNPVESQQYYEEAAEAYEVLSDADKKTQYDRFIRPERPPEPVGGQAG